MKICVTLLTFDPQPTESKLIQSLRTGSRKQAVSCIVVVFEITKCYRYYIFAETILNKWDNSAQGVYVFVVVNARYSDTADVL